MKASGDLSAYVKLALFEYLEFTSFFWSSLLLYVHRYGLHLKWDSSDDVILWVLFIEETIKDLFDLVFIDDLC